MTRVAIAVALLLGVSACSQDSTATTTEPSAASTPEAMQLVPPLPQDINPLPYGLGQTAALGNMQATLTAFDATSATVTMQVRNGDLSELVLEPALFRLYLDDGSSVQPALEPTPSIASGATWSGDLQFDVPSDRTPRLLVVDATSRGDRFLPGGFALDELTITDAPD